MRILQTLMFSTVLLTACQTIPEGQTPAIASQAIEDASENAPLVNRTEVVAVVELSLIHI